MTFDEGIIVKCTDTSPDSKRTLFAELFVDCRQPLPLLLPLSRNIGAITNNISSGCVIF